MTAFAFNRFLVLARRAYATDSSTFKLAKPGPLQASALIEVNARSKETLGECVGVLSRMIAIAFMTIFICGAARAQFSVSPNGAPTYGHSIAMSPGVAGMTPKLGLSYVGGGSGNGPVGHGWSVQGVSIITRCPTTIGTDGVRAGVNFAADDKLCIDGQRLIQIDANGNPAVGIGTNDAAGLAGGAYREYRTEIDSYARIRAYGYANSDSSGASGPAFFKVWSKSGQIFEYGDGPSRDTNTKALVNVQGKTVAMVWAVARVSDVSGNFVDYKYEQRDVAWGSGPTAGSAASGHEWNLIEVQYSGNKVVFNYDASDSRADKSEAYNRGSKNVGVRLLKSITTFVNSPNTGALGPAANAVATKTINLVYDNGPITRRSRLIKIQECAGGVSSTRCLPATRLSYAPGGDATYVASSGFNQSTLKMIDSTLSVGTVVGDFNGDGKTDFIRWSDDPTQNQLWFSNGDGSFTRAPNFNITDKNLFKSDGCYASVLVDINGDGLPDIVRYAALGGTSGDVCPNYGPPLIYLNRGDGTFALTTYSGPTLKRDNTIDFYLVDFDGDGKVDVITAGAGYMKYVGQPGVSYINPPYAWTCVFVSGDCTHVYRGNGDGTFTEVTTNIRSTPIYSPSIQSWEINSPRRVVDLDGDGRVDLASVWDGDSRVLIAPGLRSRPDGSFGANFDVVGSSGGGCSFPIDFNGDGRADCISATTGSAAGNALFVGTAGIVAGFNLINAGQELAGTGVGFMVADVNGDGRQDIIRWKDDPTQNALYLSNGDGTFTASTGFSLSSTQLRKSDGTANFVLGDFTGRGNVEILRAQTVGTTVSNQLYVKQDSTPPDQLMSVTGPNGATTAIYQVPLSNSSPAVGSPSANLGPRYISDRGTANAASLPAIDVSLPLYVVATTASDSGVGTNKVNTEYSYFGLKGDTQGRGLLGFREVRRQTPGANGLPLTIDNQYLQFHPYIGAVANSSTYNSAMNAVSSSSKLTSTSNVYCDQTALSGADTTALNTKVSCPNTSKVRRPYLLLSTQAGQDLTGVALPTTTTQTSVNATGDPTKIVVTTTGVVAGANQTFTKTITNQYQADNTSCNADNISCRWIIGRLTQTVLNSSVPNTLPSITTSAGSGQYATATTGTATAPLPRLVSPAMLMSILQLLLDE